MKSCCTWKTRGVVGPSVDVTSETTENMNDKGREGVEGAERWERG